MLRKLKNKFKMVVKKLRGKKPKKAAPRKKSTKKTAKKTKKMKRYDQVWNMKKKDYPHARPAYVYKPKKRKVNDD